MTDEVISIIIPHHNEPLEWLERAINSAIKQDVCKEIIVIDDHSDEDPEDFIKSIDFPIKYIRHGKNQKISAARNTAIEASVGTWIICLDSDDYFLGSNSLKNLLQHRDRGDILYGNLITNKDERLCPNPNIKRDDWRDNNQIFSTSAYRKVVWEVLGGFWVRDEAFPEDYDFWGRAFMEGFRFWYEPTDVYYHTYRPDSEWETMKPKFKEQREFIVKHIYGE